MLKRLFAVAAVVSRLAPASAKADLVFGENNVSHVLLVVDVSDPSGVTFTATGNVPSNNATNVIDIGVTLLGLLTVDPGDAFAVPLSGTLTPAGAGLLPYTLAVDSKSGSDNRDINLFRVEPSLVTQDFDVNNAAFSGVATGDFTGETLALPGASGNIVAFVNETGTVIGTWVAVPEPSAFLYGGLISMLASCGCWVKRRLA